MDYKTSLKEKVNKKIQALLELQDIDVEIIKTASSKKELKSKWMSLSRETEEINDDIDKTLRDIADIDANILEKNLDIQKISEEHKKTSLLQNDSKKIEEYNIHQQRIIELIKRERAVESLLDELQTKKLTLEESLEKLTKRFKKFSLEFSAKTNDIQEKIQNLNENGKKLLDSREDKANAVSDLDLRLLQRYETLVRKKGGKVIVPVNDQSCYGCNIVLTNNDISIIKRSLSIPACEHCDRMLYFSQAFSDKASKNTETTKKRVVFNLSSL